MIASSIIAIIQNEILKSSEKIFNVGLNFRKIMIIQNPPESAREFWGKRLLKTSDAEIVIASVIKQ
jgi:hypothetical protein